MSQSQCGWSSSQTSYPFRLGRHLPDQQANGTWASLTVVGPKIPTFPVPALPGTAYAVLATVSRGYPPLRGKLPMHYSPVRH